MPWDFTLILLVLGVVVPWRGAVRIRQLLRQEHVSGMDRLAAYGSTIAFQWIAVGVVVWRCSARRLRLTTLGLSVPDVERTATAAILLTVLISLNQIYSARRMASLPPERQGLLGQIARKLLPRTTIESLAFVALATTVAVCEEFLYRGFALYIAADALGSSPFGILFSSVFFALAHLYQGPRGVIATFTVGLALAGARVWAGSLAPCVVAHWVADLTAGLAAGRLLRAPRSPRGPAGGAPDQVVEEED